MARIFRMDRRRSANAISFLVTCAVLFVGVRISDGSFVRRISKISETLDRALYNVLDDLQAPNYTGIDVNATYFSSTRFNPKGMAGLHNITGMFIDAIIDKDIYPEGLLVVNNGNIGLGTIDDQWQSLLTHFGGLLAVLIILVLLAVLLPLCGFFFCCCRCCGNCGAKIEALDKKQDCCRKFVFATLLICMGTLLLFGVVCAFVTNQHMQDGTDELIQNVRHGIKDTDTYLNVTGTQLNILLVTNYRQFKSDLFDVLERSSQIVYEQLAMYSNAVAMTEVTNIVVGLEDIKTNLTQMKTITNYLRNHASQLNDALRKVKKDLLQTLNECNSNAECSRLSSNVSHLDTNIDFNSYLDRYFPKLPDVTSEMKQLDNIMAGKIDEYVAQGQNALEDIKTRIQETVSTNLDEVRDSVTNAGVQVQKSVSNITQVLHQVSDFIHDNTDGPLTDADRYIKDYSPYRNYIGLGVGCVLLLVTVCIVLGLICGICGKTPDHYDDDCCNKGAGGRFLMCGVGIMFLSGILLAVITIVYFTIGLLAQRMVCDSVRNYNTSKVVTFVDDAVNMQDALGVDVTVRQMLADCHRNRSAYTVFRLENKFNLSSITNYLQEYKIEDALQALESQLNINVSVKILSEEAVEELRKLANSNISDINFDRFTGVLDDNLTKVDLTYLVKQLNLVIDTVSRKLANDEIRAQLEVSKLHLQTYQEKLVEPMIRNAETLIDIAKNMEDSLKLGKSSFRVAITELIDEVQKAEEYLRTKGKILLTDIARNFTQAITGQVQGYLDRVHVNVRDNVGKCGPLSKVIDGALTATCEKIILPMNGFWFVLFWSLLFFIFTIVLSVKLASLYQKYDGCNASLGEAEYLYDAYADRENIPLASNGKPSKKKKKNKRYDGRSSGYAPEGGDHVGPREFPGGSHHQDTRYADMAPKQHWEDFPNGGPPQYQRAPTEYERPPPYYYPGNGEQQQH